jgi:hypothetical protein
VVTNALVTIFFTVNLNLRLLYGALGGGFLCALCLDLFLARSLLQAGKFVLSRISFPSVRAALNGPSMPKQRLQFAFCQRLGSASFDVTLVIFFKCFSFAAVMREFRRFYVNSFLVSLTCNAMDSAGNA